jgi:hypothetical protein
VIYFIIFFFFETTCTISANHHWSCEFQSRSCRGVLNTTLCDNVCQWLAAGQLCTRGNKISDNPAATPLSPFIYIRRGVLDTTLCDLRQVRGFLRFPPVINVTPTLQLKYCWKWHLTPTTLTLFSLIARYLCIYVNHIFDIFR